MVSSVKLRSNHYEALGLTPGASADEIAKAFGAQLRSFKGRPDKSVAHLAQISVAYETLRDPVKRQAYDTSLGLGAETPPAPRQDPTPFTWAAPWERPKPRLVGGAPLSPRPPAVPEPRVEPPAPQPAPAVPEAHMEPKVGSFIATSLREPIKPSEPEAAPTRAAPPQPLRTAARPVEGHGAQIDGRRASIVAGALSLGILALAVSLPKDNADRLAGEPLQAQPTATFALPPATPVQAAAPEAPPSSAAAAPVGQPEVTEEIAGQEDTPATAAPVVAEAQPEPQAQGIATEEAAAQSPPAENAAAPAAEAPHPTAAAAPARLPLPDRTVARTIERIGYPCGSVVSTTGVEGSAGVFRVTCSSGHSYQARPVGGRYRFRQWARQ